MLSLNLGKEIGSAGRTLKIAPFKRVFPFKRAQGSTSTGCVRAQEVSWVRMNHGKQSSDCTLSDSKQESKVRYEAYPACAVAVSCLEKILFAVLENGKFAVADRIGNLGVRKLMGDHWTGVTLAVDFELRMILENELEHCKALDGDHFVEAKQKLEWFQEMVMEQIFQFVRLKRFLELKGVLCEVQKEDNCLSAPGNLEERTWDGDDSFFPFLIS